MFQDIRKQYNKAVLKELNIPVDPFKLLKEWLTEAVESDEPEPTAMTLSTIDKRMQVHSRIVLLKEFDNDQLTFYTNYESDKAQQIANNPSVCLSFFLATARTPSPNLWKSAHVKPLTIGKLFRKQTLRK